MIKVKHVSYILAIIMVTLPSLSFAEEKLIFAIDLVRHGDRAPICDLPKSPLHLKEKPGELTEKGIKHELALGMELRKIYVNQSHLLPDSYEPETIYVRSTDTKRTIDSADSILAGLYPQTKISVHTISINNDALLIAHPGYNPFKLIDRYIINQQQWHKITNQHKTELGNWGTAAGMELSSWKNLNCLADNLYFRQNHHLPLPNGISKQDAKDIILLADSMTLNEFNQYSFPMGNEFLRIVNKYIADTVNHKSKLKYVLFVGHDATLMSVMHALNIPITQIPVYASRLNISIYQQDHNFIVKYSFNNKTFLTKSLSPSS